MKTFHEKRRLSDENFFHFCRFHLNLQSQQLPSDPFLDHTTCCIYKDVFSRELSNAIWKMMLEKHQILSFFNFYFIN